MSEEEIIKYKKDCDLLELTDEELINEAKATLINSMNLEDIGFRRVEKVALVGIATLLDLYNKEKEKNKDLVKRYDLLQLCYENDIDNTISKDKIKEKIEELENSDTYGYVGEEWNDKEVVELLKELLGEENEKL